MATSKDWAYILSLIQSSGRVQGRTRLQKLAFLAKKEQQLPLSLPFQLYYYGPFSSDLQDAVDSMIADGLVAEEVYSTPTGGDGYMYTLTQKGEDLLGQVKAHVSARDTKAIEKVVASYGQLPLGKLLAYVYSKYVPEDSSV